MIIILYYITKSPINIQQQRILATKLTRTHVINWLNSKFFRFVLYFAIPKKKKPLKIISCPYNNLHLQWIIFLSKLLKITATFIKGNKYCLNNTPVEVVDVPSDNKVKHWMTMHWVLNNPYFIYIYIERERERKQPLIMYWQISFIYIVFVFDSASF